MLERSDSNPRILKGFGKRARLGMLERSDSNPRILKGFDKRDFLGCWRGATAIQSMIKALVKELVSG
jgi:hypothetical protein